LSLSSLLWSAAACCRFGVGGDGRSDRATPPTKLCAPIPECRAARRRRPEETGGELITRRSATSISATPTAPAPPARRPPLEIEVGATAVTPLDLTYPKAVASHRTSRLPLYPCGRLLPLCASMNLLLRICVLLRVSQQGELSFRADRSQGPRSTGPDSFRCQMERTASREGRTCGDATGPGSDTCT